MFRQLVRPSAVSRSWHRFSSQSGVTAIWARLPERRREQLQARLEALGYRTYDWPLRDRPQLAFVNLDS